MLIVQRFLARFLLAGLLVAALLPVVEVRPAQAGGVVTNCSNDAQLDSRLAGGGTITFNCGTALINLSSTKIISANTIIDGGGKITLSGQDARLPFVVNSGVLLTLRNIVLTNGFHGGDGGAIYNNGTLSLETSTIRNSRAGLSGGAIVSTGPLRILNSLLEGNRALSGGALYLRFPGAQTMIINSVLRNNAATDTPTNGLGGAILALDGAPVGIEGSDIYSNSAQYGGGIYNFDNSVLTLGNNTRLRNNRVTGSGGGLYNRGTVMLTNITLSGNKAQGDDGGGGLYNLGTATLTNVTLSDNAAFGDGGGINNFNGTATLTNATLRGNSAGTGGGLSNWGTATLINVTLSGNHSADAGGGLLNIGNGTATLTNVTLSGNSAGTGGGIYRLSGSVVVRNSIVANSPLVGNCAGSIINGGFNLSSDTSCGFGSPVNVLLGPLANNGGPTLTHLPQPGSPAIDFVASRCPPPATDQRGVTRPVDGDGDGNARCDAGAVEGRTLSVHLPLVLK